MDSDQVTVGERKGWSDSRAENQGGFRDRQSGTANTEPCPGSSVALDLREKEPALPTLQCLSSGI